VSVSLRNDLTLAKLGDRLTPLLNTMDGPSRPTAEVLLALEEVEKVSNLHRIEELQAKLAGMKSKREERIEKRKARVAELKRKRETRIGTDRSD